MLSEEQEGMAPSMSSWVKTSFIFHPIGHEMRVMMLSLEPPYCPTAPPVSYSVPLGDGAVTTALQVYTMVYPAPVVRVSEVNLMYTWLVEARKVKGLELLTAGVAHELMKRGTLPVEGPSKILRKSKLHSIPNWVS